MAAVGYRNHAAANVGATRATSLSVGKPTGTVEGDLMVAIICCNNGTVTITAPGDWTAAATNPTNGAGNTIATFYRVAGASEGASYSFGVGVTTRSIAGTIVSLTGVNVADPEDVGSETLGDVSPIVIPALSLAAGYEIVICSVALSGSAGQVGATTPPAGFTELVDQNTTTGLTEVTQGVGYKQFAAAGDTGSLTYTIDLSGGTSRIGIAFAANVGADIIVDSTGIARFDRIRSRRTSW